MANEFSLLLNLKAAITEVLDKSLAPASSRAQRTLTHVRDESGFLNMGTTPPVAAVAVFDHVMSGDGPDTIDLTALPHAANQEVDATGLAPICVFLQGNGLTLAEGASNGYPLLGEGFSIAIENDLVLAGPMTAVSGTAKTLDVDGDEGKTLKVLIAFVNMPKEEPEP